MPPLSRKRRAPIDDDENVSTTIQTQRSRDRDSPDDYEEDEDEGLESGSGSLAQLSKNLVRYALACEYSRTPIKRQDINQKVLGSHTRAFKDVFNSANAQLLDIFGMEMVELPNREKVTMRQKRAAAASESQNKSSGQWVLQNALPDQYRVPDIISPANVPNTDVESAYTGLYTMAIALISLNGGTLSESKFDRYMRRMNANHSTPVDTYDKVLARMAKDGYIVKIRDSSGGEEVVDFMVGPRGKLEVGVEAVANMVRTVYGEGAMADLEQRISRSLGISERSVQQSAMNGGAVGSSTQTSRRGPGRPRRRDADDEDD